MKMMRFLIYITILSVVAIVMIRSGHQSVSNDDDTLERGIIYSRLESVDQVFQNNFDCNAVSPVVYTKVVSLAHLPISKRKEAFIRIVLPSILIAEQEIKSERGRLIDLIKKMKQGETLTKNEVTYIKRLFKKYRTNNFKELLVRLNTHPPSIILAQAALESGWGSSRFFVEANNIFGIWTFKGKGGLRAINSTARLATYKDTLSAVRSYLYNINVGWAYEDFRQFRSTDKEPIKLVSYLDKYSTLGDEYVQRLSDVIQINNLRRYDSCQLEPLFYNKEKEDGSAIFNSIISIFK